MMEENVALDSQKQRKFVKSIKGIKKLIQKSKEQDETRDINDDENQEASKPFSMRLKNEKSKKRTRKPRGLVYLSHIPHGFYEHQMTQYFKQFGMVTNARVIRSRRTGNSKGYAFVEFKDPSVAEIVAETMNNYLMGKRLIKAAYIPPEKQRRAFRKRWNALNNPANDTRLKMKKAYNADKDETGNLAKARKLLVNFNKTKNRLTEMGINYDFFTPVDIPEQLVGQIVKQEKQEDVNKKTSKEKKSTDKSNTVADNKTKVVDVKKKKKEEIQIYKPSVTEVPVKNNKKEKTPVNVNKQEQKQKKQTLKEVGGAKALEEFIKLDEGSDDSDSSADFDSDEYEKALENEDDSDASLDDSGESENDDDDEDDDDEDEEEESEEEELPKIPKGRMAPVPKTATQPKKQGNKQEKLLEVKRKAPQRSGGSPKKPKFEKQNQKPLKKQFKRK